MRSMLLSASFIALFASSAIAQKARDLSAEEIYRKAAPAVVTIHVKNENEKEILVGSGFRIPDVSVKRKVAPINAAKPADRKVLAKLLEGMPKLTGDCFIVTNYHVIRGAVSAEVEPQFGGRAVVFEVVTESADLDLAVLGVTYFDSTAIPTALELSKKDPTIGSAVYAIGNPQGLRNSISQGIVSGIPEIDGRTWIQTTAPISSGSSGGPLVTTNGSAVGITTMSRRIGQNLNFAVPVSKVLHILGQPLKSRPLNEGASMTWVERDAFLWCGIRGGTALEDADKLFRSGRYREALDAAIGSQNTIPPEFEYLREFTVGKTQVQLLLREDLRESVETSWRNSQHARLASQAFERAQQLNPTFTPTLYEIGMIRTHYTQELKAGLDIANRIISLMPRCARAFLLRGQCKRLVDDPTARADLERAIDLDPLQAQAHFDYAMLMSELGEFEMAVQSYQLAQQLGYIRPICLFNIGMAYKRAGNFEKAIVAFQQVQQKGDPLGCNKMILECQRGIR